MFGFRSDGRYNSSFPHTCGKAEIEQGLRKLHPEGFAARRKRSNSSRFFSFDRHPDPTFPQKDISYGKITAQAAGKAH